MSTPAFDTLGSARDPEAAGVERRQAEPIPDGMRRAASADRGELATKSGLAALEARMYRALRIRVKLPRSGGHPIIVRRRCPNGRRTCPPCTVRSGAAGSPRGSNAP